MRPIEETQERLVQIQFVIGTHCPHCLLEIQDHIDVIITYGTSSCWNSAKTVEFAVFETLSFTHNASVAKFPV